MARLIGRARSCWQLAKLSLRVKRKERKELLCLFLNSIRWLRGKWISHSVLFSFLLLLFCRSPTHLLMSTSISFCSFLDISEENKITNLMQSIFNEERREKWCAQWANWDSSADCRAMRAEEEEEEWRDRDKFLINWHTACCLSEKETRRSCRRKRKRKRRKLVFKMRQKKRDGAGGEEEGEEKGRSYCKIQNEASRLVMHNW